MTTLRLNKNFGHLLVDPSFLPNEEKYLILRLQSKKGHLVKKQVKETDKFIQSDIKIIESAFFGKGDEKIDVLDKIKSIMDNDREMAQFYSLNKLFYSFCKTYLKVLCPRCFIKNNLVKNFNPHNSGLINLLFKNCHSSYEPELFHGLVKCFIAVLINEDSNLFPNKKERWIETFSYIVSNISNQNENQNHFIMANIIHNYMTNNQEGEKYIVIENKLKLSTKNAISSFYSRIYPVLRYFNENKDDMFIRHGLEKKTDEYEENMIFPPNDSTSGWRLHKVTTSQNQSVATNLPAYPIEYDTSSLKVCSLHSSKEIYGNVKGYIAKEYFKRGGGIIHFRYEKDNSVTSREHLFAESNIHVKNWVFTYKENSRDTLKNEVKSATKAIVNANLFVMSEEGLTLFNHILDMTTRKFLMLH